jgi:hypothetical protein
MSFGALRIRGHKLKKNTRKRGRAYFYSLKVSIKPPLHAKASLSTEDIDFRSLNVRTC